MASGESLENKRLNAQWQVAATLNMSVDNAAIDLVKKQPAGVYSLADLNEMANWIKWYLGRTADPVRLAKWFPSEVYQAIIGKIVDFTYNRTAIGDLFKPPENAAGGSGQCTCDVDAYGDPARDILCFKWDFVDFIEQASGVESGGWTFSGLSAGVYVLVFDNYSTNESFPTTYLTVT